MSIHYTGDVSLFNEITGEKEKCTDLRPHIIYYLLVWVYLYQDRVKLDLWWCSIHAAPHMIQ